MPQTFVLPRQVILADGLVSAGAIASFYRTGTTQAQAVYTDAALTVAVTSITADSAGVFQKVYLDSNAPFDYRVKIESASGSLIAQDDDIGSVPIEYDELVALLNPATDVENATGVTVVDHSIASHEATGGIVHPQRYGWDSAASATVNTEALEAALDVAEQIDGEVRLPAGAASFNGDLSLRSGVSIRGSGPFSTILTCETAGVHGFKASTALSGVTLADFQLLGSNVANASEDGIHIVGGASGGFPKLLLRNLLVKQWGNVGVYLENCFDCAVENVNSSSNKSHGFQIISCFAASGLKNVAFQNSGHGFYIQSAAGSLFNGNAQENSLNGWLVESAQGCHFNTYAEQNGHAGTTVTTAQFRATQRAGGFKPSMGNVIVVFCIGGKGSTSPVMESGYGVYLDFAEDNTVHGTLGGHLTNDVIFTTNSERNKLGAVSFDADVGSVTTTQFVNNSTVFAAFTSLDATPSVILGDKFVTANASATTVTALDDGYVGKEVLVKIGDANTTIDFSGTTLKGNGGIDWTPASGDFMRCVHDGTNWLCTVTNVAAGAAYTATNVTPTHSYDADTVLIEELADVVGTLIADLRLKGLTS